MTASHVCQCPASIKRSHVRGSTEAVCGRVPASQDLIIPYPYHTLWLFAHRVVISSEAGGYPQLPASPASLDTIFRYKSLLVKYSSALSCPCSCNRSPNRVYGLLTGQMTPSAIVCDTHWVHVLLRTHDTLCNWSSASHRVYGLLTGQQVHDTRRLHFPGSQPVSLARANLGLLQMQRWAVRTRCCFQILIGRLSYHQKDRR
jgi:hypothetical protein